MAKNNKALSAAGQAKKDEFYTQIVDIENELRHYKEHFKGKVVFCNCDDPYESNFFKYFPPFCTTSFDLSSCSMNAANSFWRGSGARGMRIEPIPSWFMVYCPAEVLILPRISFRP